MPSLFDYLERAFTGPIMTQKDFHLKVLIPNIRKIVKEYEITYDPAVPVPSDDQMADRLFTGAIDFLERTGLYCSSTNRIVLFHKDEILRDLSHYREAGTFGEGRDRATLKPRRPGDTTPPWCHIGTGIVATSEEIALAQVEGYAQVVQANSISIPALETVRGVPIVGGSPLELYGVFSAIATGRRALWRAGRPGLPILNLCSASTTDTGTIAGCYPSVGLRPSDGWLIDFLAEMTIDFNNMNKLTFVNYIGGNVGSTDLAILGGYAGGAPGTALVMTAYHIAGCVFMKGAYHLTGPGGYEPRLFIDPGRSLGPCHRRTGDESKHKLLRYCVALYQSPGPAPRRISTRRRHLCWLRVHPVMQAFRWPIRQGLSSTTE